MNYTLPMRYFFVMLVMLLGSGAWMFALHTSFEISSITSYYEPKSLFGALETVVPHLFGMSLIAFILMHFFAVAKPYQAKQKQYKRVSLILLALIALLNLTSFIISQEWVVMSYLKLITLMLFITITLWFSFLLALKKY
jgi:hypothetical protein